MDPSVKLVAPAHDVTHKGSKSVINLCKNFVLTAAQFSVLDRGLNFIPTRGSGAKNTLNQIRSDLQQYHRRIKLAVYFEREPDSRRPPFTPKSNWVPPESSLPRDVSLLVDSDLTFFRDVFHVGWVKDNLASEEFDALFSLKNNHNIVIKPADKGSAVVLMDREQYLWEGYRQLNNTTYYSKLPRPIYPDTVPLVLKIVNSLWAKRFINHKQRNYLVGGTEPRPRLFYMLPKIHKDPALWSRPHEVPPGRPIVSDCSSETCYTAEFIDFYLNPLSIRHASYVKDTYDFVNKINNMHIPANSLLFTMDVDSLYTNIDIPEGLRAVENIFHSFPDVTRPDAELLQLLEINLTRNDFLFNGESFLQVKGTAMGKKFAPAYANIFMARWEMSALASCSKKPLYYLRYLDDIWGVWPHSREDFNQFLVTLNAHNPSISLKYCLSPSSVDFLDTTTFKGPLFSSRLKLDVKVFFKDTDTHALLHKSSFHPKHTYAGLLKSQLLRFDRICTRRSDFVEATRVLFKALATRGYSRSFLRKSVKTFKGTKPPIVGPRLPFITTYSPSSMLLVRQIKTHFSRLLNDTQLLRNHGIIAAYRKNNNLQDILVRAKLRPLSHPRSTRHGEFFQYQPWVHNQHNHDVFPTQKHCGPGTKNCVYLIRCRTCNVQYVGETRNTLLTRFAQHRYNICREKETHIPLVSHFIQHGWPALTASVLESNPVWSTAMRRRTESLWMRRLGTIQPGGLNVRVGRGIRVG